MHLGTRSLTLTVDGIPRTADVSDCRVVSGALDSSERLLCGPDRLYRLQCTAAQDLTPGSLWDLLWSRQNDLVEVLLAPTGSTAPTPEGPWFAGTVRITESDGDLLGGAANSSPSARFTFTVDWAFTAKPTRIEA